MRYHPLTTPQPTPEAEIDSPAIIEAAAFVESGDELLGMLAELARYGMELAQAQRDYAMARLAAVTADGSALNPGEDPAAAFNKISQTVRRTIALQLKLKEDIGKRRSGLAVDRAANHAEQTADHAVAVKDAIHTALTDVFYADLVQTDLDPSAAPNAHDPVEFEHDEMLEDAERLLDDLGDYRDWLNRPVGETVAKLCVSLGLRPDSCIKRGDAWMIRRPDTEYEIIRDSRQPSSSSLAIKGRGEEARSSP